jgi:transcriptional/translational regulatory protein YebC/TACO1
MAGHNKWPKIKRAKDALDDKRGEFFSQFSKAISIAVKLSGGNPSLNPELRTVFITAIAQSMLNDNIDRANLRRPARPPACDPVLHHRLTNFLARPILTQS